MADHDTEAPVGASQNNPMLQLIFVQKTLTTRPSKLLEFYLPQAYELQPKTLCKESKD